MAAPPERADGSALEDHEDLRARRGLAQVLEDGPLKRELLGTRPAPPAPPGPPLGYSARLTFDGPAAEYFRIWIVNLLLTLVTMLTITMQSTILSLKASGEKVPGQGIHGDMRASCAAGLPSG